MYGFCYTVQKRVRELNETEKYRNETDLDRDAVAEVGARSLSLFCSFVY